MNTNDKLYPKSPIDGIRNMVKNQCSLFANWISKNYVPNGRDGCWDSIELNSQGEPKYMVDSDEALFIVFAKETGWVF